MLYVYDKIPEVPYALKHSKEGHVLKNIHLYKT